MGDWDMLAYAAQFRDAMRKRRAPEIKLLAAAPHPAELLQRERFHTTELCRMLRQESAEHTNLIKNLFKREIQRPFSLNNFPTRLPLERSQKLTLRPPVGNPPQRSDCCNVQFSADGTLFAAISQEGDIRVWTVDKTVAGFAPLCDIDGVGVEGAVTSMAIGPDSARPTARRSGSKFASHSSAPSRRTFLSLLTPLSPKHASKRCTDVEPQQRARYQHCEPE